MELAAGRLPGQCLGKTIERIGDLERLHMLMKGRIGEIGKVMTRNEVYQL